jgi:hypothetical protein
MLALIFVGCLLVAAPTASADPVPVVPGPGPGHFNRHSRHRAQWLFLDPTPTPATLIIRFSQPAFIAPTPPAYIH